MGGASHHLWDYQKRWGDEMPSRTPSMELCSYAIVSSKIGQRAKKDTAPESILSCHPNARVRGEGGRSGIESPGIQSKDTSSAIYCKRRLIQYVVYLVS
jgi:hypothetical protein